MTNTLSRRAFLSTPVILAGVASTTAAAPTSSFTFLHLTDLHIQPELRADEGCRLCIDAARRIRPDFVLGGGDMIFDAADQSLERAKQLYGLLGETVKRLEVPLHTCVGNHDLFGSGTKSNVPSTEAGWGKRMFEDRIGPRYHSFDHKGWHFIVLDSIGLVPGGGYRGEIDEQQLSWLRADVEASDKRPTVVLTHIPLLTSAPQLLLESPGARTDGMVVSNARDVLAIFERGNVKMVLQGHTHICETVDFKGCQYITSGAVSGNWWKGARMGFREGFGIVRVSRERISWEYRTYGFTAQS